MFNYKYIFHLTGMYLFLSITFQICFEIKNVILDRIEISIIIFLVYTQQQKKTDRKRSEMR